MRRLIAVIGVGVAVVASYAYQARAGFKSNNTVSISGNSAFGSLGAARNSADGNQYIGCDYWIYGNLYCRARNSANVVVSCSSGDPEFISLSHSINGDSWVNFNSNASGICTYLEVDNGSWYMPKSL
jgi:hypothetical protein